MIEVNGMAHVILTVSDWEKSHAFYAELMLLAYETPLIPSSDPNWDQNP